MSHHCPWGRQVGHLRIRSALPRVGPRTGFLRQAPSLPTNRQEHGNQAGWDEPYYSSQHPCTQFPPRSTLPPALLPLGSCIRELMNAVPPDLTVPKTTKHQAQKAAGANVNSYSACSPHARVCSGHSQCQSAYCPMSQMRKRGTKRLVDALRDAQLKEQSSNSP